MAAFVLGAPPHGFAKGFEQLARQWILLNLPFRVPLHAYREGAGVSKTDTLEPHHYGGPPFPDDEIIDPRRDATVLPLIRACIEQEVPVFGICRGIQEINVALGGTLH